MTLPLLESDLPLCFDTNAVWGENEAARQLLRIRDRFPKRRLLIPAWVVAERVRQLAVSRGPKFDPKLVSAFLENSTTGLEIVPFSQETSINAWRAATSNLPRPWDWKDQAQTQRPCAERCRIGDYLVYACAIEHKAILVTGDKILAKQALHAGTLPGVVSMTELLQVC